jgi:hypothetical protein
MGKTLMSNWFAISFMTGIAFFIVGMGGLFALYPVEDDIISSLFFLSVVSGLVQLGMHMKHIYSFSGMPLTYKLLLFWVLLCFGLISGYILTMLCWYKKVSNISQILPGEQ